jgi:hypothetical protein
MRKKSSKKKNVKWIQKAHLKTGALSKTLGIPEKKDIPMSILRKEKKSKNKKTAKRANLAITLKKLAKRKKK